MVHISSLKAKVISAVSLITFVIIWQLACSFKLVSPILLPSPLQIIDTVVDLTQNGYRDAPFYQHILVSTARAFFAFFIAIIIGVPLGLLMGRTPVLNAIFDPFVQFLRPIPKIALIPLVVVWLGIGEESKFFLIFIATFLSVIVGSTSASHNVPTGLIQAAQTMGLGRTAILFRVILPSSLPELFTTIRLSIGIGWTSLIAAEMVAANSGLGWMIINAGSYLRTDVVIVGIILLGMIGFLLDWLIVKAQQKWAPWTGKA
ncbi:taurine ABC transporter permease [Acinetobacter sp. ANC 4558]|uniref:ABC transporter permease n=1 Tax=Acinetobacter sp. ANC 4558 TaxID=1977876 RepID=UPI000A3306C1|nr:ABC transporter permease [Acinetobacter sp. ANC 4558]OTG86735.1 taurine ABC transporter permease [Acinetobacter sp. ANC 4558]